MTPYRPIFKSGGQGKLHWEVGVWTRLKGGKRMDVWFRYLENENSQAWGRANVVATKEKGVSEMFESHQGHQCFQNTVSNWVVGEITNIDYVRLYKHGKGFGFSEWDERTLEGFMWRNVRIYLILERLLWLLALENTIKNKNGKRDSSENATRIIQMKNGGNMV